MIFSLCWRPFGAFRRIESYLDVALSKRKRNKVACFCRARRTLSLSRSSSVLLKSIRIDFFARTFFTIDVALTGSTATSLLFETFCMLARLALFLGPSCYASTEFGYSSSIPGVILESNYDTSFYPNIAFSFCYLTIESRSRIKPLFATSNLAWEFSLSCFCRFFTSSTLS